MAAPGLQPAHSMNVFSPEFHEDVIFRQHSAENGVACTRRHSVTSHVTSGQRNGADAVVATAGDNR